MFEKIILNRSISGPAITVGELAEALLFYQNVHITLDYGSLAAMIKEIGMGNLLSLLARPNVSAVYSDQTLGVRTETINGIPKHSFIAFSLVGNKDGEKLNSRKKRVANLLERQGYDKKRARRYSENFKLRVPARLPTSDYYIDGGVVEAAKQDLLDTSFISDSMKLVLAENAKVDFDQNEIIFRAVPYLDGFSIETNLNFDLINSQRKAMSPALEDVSLAHFINHILSSKLDAIMAAHYGGEFYTSQLSSNIIQLKNRALLKRAGIERKEIEEFSSIVIGDFPRVRDIINSRERSFDEFLKLLDKSDKFREWAKGVNPDEKLVKEYWGSVSSVGWINKIPSKSLRYVMNTTIGAINPGAGLFASAADTFLVEKIFGGWRPSHFVDRHLKPFLDE